MDIADKGIYRLRRTVRLRKSTTLRMIAGLEEITAGELRIGDMVVNDMEPKTAILRWFSKTTRCIRI